MNALMPSLRVSVVVPAYQEGLGIAAAIDAIEQELRKAAEDYEILIVDDGSRDDTYERVRQIAATNSRVRGLRLSRNFGKEGAILAGLCAALGDAVITMDADLQHPPALIPEMIDAWCAGAQVVNAVKRRRARESLLVRWRAAIFNAIFTKLSGMNLLNASDFKLLDRQVVNIIVDSFPERIRFYRGLTEWIGFSQTNLQFDVPLRKSGKSSFHFGSLVSLSLTAILGHTSAPLRIVTILGALAMSVGAAIATEALLSWARGSAVSGFVTLIVTMLLLGSSIMVSLGIIGEYLAKIYNEIKGRPGYLIASACGQENAVRIERRIGAGTPPVGRPMSVVQGRVQSL